MDLNSFTTGLIKFDINIWSFVLVFAFLGALLLIAAAAAFFVALKKNWIILSYPINVLFLKPTGDSFQPFVDKAAIITEDNQQKWILRGNKVKFSPPRRDYILPGGWLFAWSSNYRDIVPLKPSLIGFSGQVEEARIQELWMEANKEDLNDDQKKSIIETAREEVKDIEEAKREEAFRQRVQLLYVDAVKLAREEKFNVLLEAEKVRHQQMQLMLKPKVDTSIMNSMFAEGDKHIRQHKLDQNWLIIGGLVIIMIIVIVSLMLMAAQGMGFNEAQKETSDAIAANAHAIDNLAKVLNESKTINVPTPINLPGK